MAAKQTVAPGQKRLDCFFKPQPLKKHDSGSVAESKESR